MNLHKYFDYSKTHQISREYHHKKSLGKAQDIPFEIRPTEMLYDLENDTWQMHNLANSPKHKDIMNEFRALLDAKLTESKDVHFIPEYALDSISKIMTPYEFKRSET